MLECWAVVFWPVQEKLSAPDGLIGTVSCAIEDKAEEEEIGWELEIACEGCEVSVVMRNGGYGDLILHGCLVVRRNWAMHSSLVMHLLGKSVGMVAWVVIGEDVQGGEWVGLEFLSDLVADGCEDFGVTSITEVLGAADGVRVANGKGCFEISAKRDARRRIEICFGGARIQDGKSHGACATRTANGSGVGESCCGLG